jgi:hypothetical protein
MYVTCHFWVARRETRTICTYLGKLPSLKCSLRYVYSDKVERHWDFSLCSTKSSGKLSELEVKVTLYTLYVRSIALSSLLSHRITNQKPQTTCNVAYNLDYQVL